MAQWELAKTSGLLAVRDLQGNVIIAASGEKPTPCHEVNIRQRPELIFPPRYEVVWKQAGFCPEVMTPYAVHSQPFIFPVTTKSLQVLTADGMQAVPIADLPIPVCPMPEAVAAHNDGLQTATGYSTKFSFDEAFENAISQLPRQTGGVADELVRVTVSASGAEFGGIVGLRRMFVTVVRARV